MKLLNVNKTQQLSAALKIYKNNNILFDMLKLFDTGFLKLLSQSILETSFFE